MIKIVWCWAILVTVCFTNDQERMMLSDIINSMLHQRYDVERYYWQWATTGYQYGTEHDQLHSMINFNGSRSLWSSKVVEGVTYVHDRYGPGDEMNGILGPFRMTRSRLIGDVEMTRSSMAGSDFDTMYMMMIWFFVEFNRKIFTHRVLGVAIVFSQINDILH